MAEPADGLPPAGTDWLHSGLRCPGPEESGFVWVCSLYLSALVKLVIHTTAGVVEAAIISSVSASQ